MLSNHSKTSISISSSQLIISSILLISFIFCLINHRSGHNWGDDFALYIHQAKAIANRDINEVIASNAFCIKNSSAEGFSPITAPWGFPILLTPIYFIYGLNINAFKIFISVCFVAFLYAYYHLLKDKIESTIALMLSAFMGLNFVYIDYTNNVLSEIPFLFFATYTLIVIQNYHSSQSVIKRGIILGLFLYFSFIIRSEGITLFAALASWQLKQILEKKERASTRLTLWLITPYLTAIIVYVIASSIFPSGFTSHFSYSKFLKWENVGLSLVFYKNAIAQILVPGFNTIISYTILISIVIGLVKRFRKDIHICIYLLSMVVIFLIWPFREGRYLFTTFPFFLYFSIQGFIQLNAFKWRVNLPHIALGVLIILNLVRTSNTSMERMQTPSIIEGPETKESAELFKFIKEETSKDDVIIFFRPRAMNLYTERRSAMVFDKWSNLSDKGNYFVLNNYAGNFYQFDPSNEFMSTREFEQKYKIVFSNYRYTAFKILK